MIYDDLKTALTNTGIPFADTAWAVAPSSDFGVVSLDGAGDSVIADDSRVETVLEGTVDLFCHNSSLTNMQTIETVLDGIEFLSWRLNSIQFEDDTKLTHYEWVIQFPITVDEDEDDG